MEWLIAGHIVGSILMLVFAGTVIPIIAAALMWYFSWFEPATMWIVTGILAAISIASIIIHVIMLWNDTTTGPIAGIWRKMSLSIYAFFVFDPFMIASAFAIPAMWYFEWFSMITTGLLTVAGMAMLIVYYRMAFKYEFVSIWIWGLRDRIRYSKLYKRIFDGFY